MEQPNEAIIVFEDSREIDALISMLEEFKIKSSGFLGTWHEKHT